MRRFVYVFLGIVVFFFVSGCGSTKESLPVILSSSSNTGYTTTYVIGTSPVFQRTLYGVVVADGIKNIVSNRGGILEYLDCQPGKEVSKNTLIAKIIPNEDDVTYQNSKEQLSVLQEQARNFTTLITLTEHTLSLQKQILRDQYENNATLLANLRASESYTDSSLQYQKQLLEQQYDTLQATKSIDLQKMKTSVANAYKQNLIMIKDALKKINDVFGGSLPVGDKDPDLKQQILSEYQRLYNKISDTMEASEFSTYLSDVADLMVLASRGIGATTPSTIIPQSSTAGISLDSLSSAFTALANTFMSSKSAFDTLFSSYESVKVTYNSQLQSLTTNIANFAENTEASTKLSLENQKANLLLAQKTLAKQLESSEDNQVIQLMSLKNQLLTLQQNIAVLSNNLEGEYLYADVDGVVKMRALSENNKIAPNTMLCQILPNNPSHLSIQVSSYQRLSLGTKVTISNQQGVFLGTGVIVYEYPYKDSATQHYIYEIPLVTFSAKENERVLITLFESGADDNIWIPLYYVSPRLEGYLVKRKLGTGVQEVYVQLGTIHNNYVQVISGLYMGDEIVK